MQNTMKALFQKLSQAKHIYVNEVTESRQDYHGFAYSDVRTTSKGNCITMREHNGCMINLKDLDERATTRRYVYVWTFYEDFVRLERYRRQKVKRLLDLEEVDGCLVNKTDAQSQADRLSAEVMINDDSVEVMITKGDENAVEDVCIEFRRSRRTYFRSKKYQNL